MKPVLLATTLFGLAVLASACSTANTVTRPDGPGPNGETPGPAEEESDDPREQPPHSLGTIVLGESHASSSKANPVVFASFRPDARIGAACSTKVAGCDVVKVAKCTKSATSINGCNDNETCAYDETSCTATCKKIVVCDDPCDTDTEVCQATNATSTTGKCVKKESFDAGPLAFSGTTTPITLYPPYAFESDGSGAPFLASAELRVQAAGATEAGFEKFDETFTATTFLQTSPALNKLEEENVFGTGPLSVSWVPGNDKIVVTVAGTGGSASCKGVDKDGKLDVPREVIDLVLGETAGQQTSLSISVSRQRKEVRKDKVAKGQLASVEVIPEGWLELVTTSTESAAIQGCNKCASESCTSCVEGAQQPGGACTSQYEACGASAECAGLVGCINGCSSETCVNDCAGEFPGGVAPFQALNTCLQSTCGAVCPQQ